MTELEQAVERLKVVRETWADSRCAKLSTKRKRAYLVGKATKGGAFMVSHEAYRANQELHKQAVMEVER